MDTLSLARFDRMLTLPSGERVRLRPIRPDDEPRLSELYDRSSRDTRYQRFFTVMRRLPPDWAHFLANVDYDRRLAALLETGPSLHAKRGLRPTAENLRPRRGPQPLLAGPDNRNQVQADQR